VLRLRPRYVTVLAALIAAGFTDIVMAVPSMHFAYRSVAVHAMLEVTASLIALVTTVLVWGRLRYRQGLDDLLLFIAIGLLSVTSLLFAVIPAAIWREPHPFSTWTTLITSGLGALLLATAALVRPARIRDYEHVARIAVVVVAFALVSIGAVVGLFIDRLPIGLDPARSPVNVPGPINGNVGIASVQMVIALLFVAAAIGFTRRAESTGDEFYLWLGAGAVFAAFARANYVMFPSLYSEWVYTGDLLRLIWNLLLFIGAVREIRVYQNAYVEARVLDERRRIARDLHDGLAQELAYVATKTRELAGGSSSRVALLQVASAAQRGLDESRRAIQALTTNDDAPFDVALVEAVEEVAARLGTNVEIDAEPAPEVTASQREQLLRIVREAVSNAGCHANAEVVRVRFTNGGPLYLSVEDDGVGFDPDAVNADGFGLVTMSERAHAIGADFRIQSSAGFGTKVEVVL
jgi:signal transduction histidine kinase